MQILLSGLFGAIIATLVNVCYNYISERARRREEVLMEVVKWLDDIYSRLQAMNVQKERVYAGQEPSLTEGEYRFISKELRTMILASKIQTMVAIVYGEEERLQRINALQGELTKVAYILWKANKNNWTESSKQILNSFNKTIDPLRESTLRIFLNGTKHAEILKDFIINNLPTFYRILRSTSKKS